MNIISWNVKSFVSCVTNGTNALVALQNIILTFDLAVLYEVPNSTGGDNALTTLMNALIPAPPILPYMFFSEPGGGLGKENDQVAVIWNPTTTTVVNTTAARRGENFAGGREPVYFNVTEHATAHTRECCAWHAPAPGGNASAFIPQGWQNILQNSQDNAGNPLTSIVMGDFNSDFSNPATSRRRRPGSFLRKQILAGATTLRPRVLGSPSNVLSYRSTSLYDQFYVNTGVVTVNRVGIYDVLDRLVNNIAPLTGFGTQYNTARKAYDFYYPNLSDHLPVAMSVTL